MRRLSRRHLTLFVLTGVLLLGGHAAAGARKARGGWQFKVKADKVVTLDGGSLRVRFVKVADDSRCPEGVTCVWQGNAEVLVEVGGEDWEGKKTLKLLTSPPAERASGEKYGSYTLKLIDLSPYPSIDRKIDPGQYEATLLVSKE